MLVRIGRGNTLDAPGIYADVGRYLAMFRAGLRAPRRPFGVSKVHRPKSCCGAKPIGTFCVPMVPGVSCLAGSVGIYRGGNVTAERLSDPASAGHSGLWIGDDDFSLSLKSRCQRRATAGGTGVSNR